MTFWEKRKKAFGYAFQGIATLFGGETHARIHAVAALLVILAGVFFHVSAAEWCLLILCIGGVWMAEGFNTAVEALADKVSPQRDPLIKKAKDVAAGAVLLFVFAAVAVGLIVFIPKIISLCKGVWQF